MRIDDALVVLEQVEELPVETSELDKIEQFRGRALIAFRRGRLDDLAQITDQLQAVSRQAGPHLRTHADVYSALLAFTRGDWEKVNAFAVETDRLMRSSPTTAFCVSAAIMLATGALAQARAGRFEEARALVRRMDAITYEKVVSAALRRWGWRSPAIAWRSTQRPAT